VNSVDVTNERLMSRLMDADLLGGNDHPTISFRSTRVEPTDAARWKVTGDITIHGVTKPVVLDTHFLGHGVHPFSKKVSAAFRVETAVDRSQFGVTWNAALDTGGRTDRDGRRQTRSIASSGCTAHSERQFARRPRAHVCRRRRGSSRSRRPSPRKLIPSTVSRMASPGKTAIQPATVR